MQLIHEPNTFDKDPNILPKKFRCEEPKAATLQAGGRRIRNGDIRGDLLVRRPIVLADDQVSYRHD